MNEEFYIEEPIEKSEVFEIESDPQFVVDAE